MTSLTVLKLAAAAEAITVTLLFANLLSVHWPAASSTLGPTHGTAYLATVVTALTAANAPAKAKLLSFVPAVGGYLALRVLGSQVPAGQAAGER